MPEHLPILWTRQFVAERWSEPISPLSASLLLERFVGDFLHYPRVSGVLCEGVFPTRVVDGYVYLNASLFLNLFERLHLPAPDFILELFPQDIQETLRARPWGLPDIHLVGKMLQTAALDNLFPTIDIDVLHNPQHWEDFLQDYLAQLKTLRKVTLEPLSRDELWQFYKRCEGLLFRYRKIHLGSLLIGNFLYQVLGFLLQRWVAGDIDPLKAGLVKGIPGSKTIEMNKGLWLLAQKLSEDEALSRRILSLSPEELVQALDTPPFRPFQRLLQGYLSHFGHRSLNSYELKSASWKENPLPVIEAVQSYLRDANHGGDPFELERRQIDDRRRLTEEVLSQIASGSSWLTRGTRREIFLRLLDLNHRYMLLRENQRFYFDLVITLMKEAFGEIGKRLAEEKRLDDGEDIYFLQIDEIEECFLKDASHLRRVRQRKRLYREAFHTAPPTYMQDDEPYAERAGVAGHLKGIGVSPGVREGVVRVITFPDQFIEFREGEILVTMGTDPGWTPLFIRASALVTEIGGLLSHGAVVAREYGLPAVVGVPLATKKLQTGQRVVVDGLRGTVECVGM